MLRTSGKRDAYTTGVQRVAQNRVSKLVGDNVVVEFHKAQAVVQALAGTRFTTPMPLTCDLDTSRIEFEYIDGMISLYDTMVRAYRNREFELLFSHNRTAGELLATLHCNLKLSSAVVWEPPPAVMRKIHLAGVDWAAEKAVYLHCDYSPVNVLTKPNGELVVIDAAPNQYFTQRADLMGPPLVDIATYTAKLFWPFRVRAFTPAGRRMAHRLRGDFLATYAQISGHQTNSVLLRILERAVVRGFVARKTNSRLLSIPAMALARVALPN